MSCIHKDSLVECVKEGKVYLEFVHNIRKETLLYDPVSEIGSSVVKKVVFENSSNVFFSLFGLKCAGPQMVLYNGMWSRAESLHKILPTPVEEHNFTLVGLILKGSCNIRVDGVICKGIRQEEWEIVNSETAFKKPSR